MARLNIELPDDLMLRFRTTVLKRKGSLKSNTSEAVKEALEDYCRKYLSV